MRKVKCECNTKIYNKTKSTSNLSFLMRRRNARDPATLHRSPMLIKFVSGPTRRGSNPAIVNSNTNGLYIWTNTQHWHYGTFLTFYQQHTAYSSELKCWTATTSLGREGHKTTNHLNNSELTRQHHEAFVQLAWSLPGRQRLHCLRYSPVVYIQTHNAKWNPQAVMIILQHYISNILYSTLHGFQF